MSFQIQQPGFYFLRNGGKAEVFAERDGWWYGVIYDSDYANTVLTSTSWRSNGRECDDDESKFDLTDPWHDIPEPPAGFVVRERDYVAKAGDMCRLPHWDEWKLVKQSYDWSGHCCEELDKQYPDSGPHYIASPIPAPPKPKLEPGEGWRLLEDTEAVREGDEYFSTTCGVWTVLSLPSLCPYSQCTGVVYRRRIPAPFRISDKGCGIYETRDGRREPVRRRGGFTDKLWCGDKSQTWDDDGYRYNNREDDESDNLVRYIGPLPAPETTLKFIVGDKVRTIDGYGNEHQCTVMAVPGAAHSDYLVGRCGWSAWRSPSALEEENAAPETWTPGELRWLECGYGGELTVVLAGTCKRLQQRWTSGERSEWRPVPVEAAT